MGLASATLVGRFQGRWMGNNTPKEWMKDNWEPFMGCSPICFSLSWGWLAMVFWYLKVAKRVLNHRSKWGFQPLLLKRWTPNFYMKNERPECVSIWVKFRSLPLIFWYEEVFMEIRFIFYGFWKLNVACILVTLDLKEGLLKSIALKKRGV